MSEPTDRTSQAELRALLRTIEDAGWEYARLEINGIRLEVSKNADFELASGAAPAALTATTPTATTPAATHPTAGASAAAPADPPAGAPVEADSSPVDLQTSSAVETVISPTIGLAWRSPKPGAPSFVEVGDTVTAGSTVCIVEVMKLMTHVVAPVSGVIHAIHITNGSMVEHGTVLMDIVPASAA